MKTCEICGDEISTPDGDNRCYACEDAEAESKAKRATKARRRRERHQTMLDCGLVRVRGALGGTYYE